MLVASRLHLTQTFDMVESERGNDFHPKRCADASYEKSVMQFTFEVDFFKTLKNQLAGSCTGGFNCLHMNNQLNIYYVIVSS